MCSGAQSFPVTRIGPTRQKPAIARQPNHLGSTHAGRGFPHSEISGSKFVRNSPELIAAYHVLHRLSVPRHPPNALKTLDRSHHQCSPPAAPQEQPVDHTTDKTILLRIHPMPARCTPRDPAPSPPRRDGRNPARNRMNVLFTMSNNPQTQGTGNARRPNAAQPQNRTASPSHGKTAKRRSPATQRSPAKPEWWSQTGSNRRPHACKARALPAELWPHSRRACKWWAWEDLNFRPHAYQARALTN